MPVSRRHPARQVAGHWPARRIARASPRGARGGYRTRFYAGSDSAAARAAGSGRGDRPGGPSGSRAARRRRRRAVNRTAGACRRGHRGGPQGPGQPGGRVFVPDAGGGMTTDIVTVMWKEWKELLESQFSPRGGLLFLIVILTV